MMSDPLRRSALRHVQIAVCAYLLILIVATHWPKLEVNPVGAPIDKLLHFLAFGLMTIALSFAQWFTRWWTLLLAAAVFTILDELTQSLFSTGRHFSMADAAAGWMGVIVAVALVQAFGPVGGPGARERRERWIDAAASLLARPAPWLLIGISGALGVLVGGFVLLLLDGFYPRPHPARALIMGGVLGGAALSHWAFEVGVRRETLLLQKQHRCRGCGRGFNKEERAADRPRCPHCGRLADPADWEPLVPLSRDVLVSAIFRPTLIAGVLLVLFGVLWLSLLFARDWLAIPAWWDQLGIGAQGVVDLSVVGLLAAATLRVVRTRLALQIDAQASRCLACGQDLTGVPMENGLGRCPECGGRFRGEQSAVCSSQ